MIESNNHIEPSFGSSNHLINNNTEKGPDKSMDYMKIQEGDHTHTKIQVDQGIVVDDYYMGKDSNCFTRTFNLHFFNILPAYFTHFYNKRLIDFRPEYQPMVSNKYLWHRFRSNKQNFNIYKQLFIAERGPIIAVLVISLLIGVLALFGAYFQRYLFSQIIDSHFPTSGWVYFGLISGSAILRFFLFNWAQNIANESAINCRCYIQNALIKLVFYLPDHMNEGNLLNNMFISADIARSAIQLIPYFFASLIIVFGIVAFIIDILGHIGWIVLGLTLLIFALQFFFLTRMLHLHHQYVHVADKRTSLLLQCTQGLMKLAKNGIAKIYFTMLDEERKKQTNIQMKYNFLDGFIQVLTESVSFISIFIFYIVSQATLVNSGQSNPNYKQILEAVILFSVFKTPVKMVAYGLCMGLEGYAALSRLQQLFDKCGYVPIVSRNEQFIRQYPNKSFFQSTLNIEARQQNINHAVIPVTLHTFIPEDNRYKGKLTMILGKLDANPDCDKFLNQIETSLPYRLSYYRVDNQALIEDKSIKQNIIFGSAFDQTKYHQVLETVHLKSTLSQFPEGDDTKMHQNYFKTIYFGLELKIQLARALYCEVDVLTINRLVFKQYETLLKALKKYRQQRNQTTIIVNLSGSFYDIADTLIVLGKNGSKQQGTYAQLKAKKSRILQQFQLQSNAHHELIIKQEQQDNEKLQTHVSKLQDEPIDVIDFKFTDIFRFYGLTNFIAPFILLILIILPPLLDLYMQVIVAQSARIWENSNQLPIHSSLVQNNFLNAFSSLSSETAATSETTTDTQTNQISFDHIITLRYGITALAFVLSNILKILVFSLFLKKSGYMIVRKVASRLFSRKIQNILSASNRRNALNLERNIDNIDTRVTADLDVGMTIIFQQLTALIFGAVSSVLFLAIGIPFFFVTFLIILIMIKFNRKILMLRRNARSKFNSFIKKLIIHRKTYVHMKKTKYITEQFTRNNKIDIIADLNEQWMMQSLGMILQIVFILLLIVTMAVSLTKFSQIHKQNPAFIELAISFLIGMTNGGRINLKIFQSMDFQLVGVSSIFKIVNRYEQEKNYIHQHYDIKQHREVSAKNINNPNFIHHLILSQDFKLSTLKFINFTVKFKDDIIQNVNLQIKRGERIVITGSRRGGKRIMIYGIMGIFEHQHIQGDIELNQKFSIYKNRISKHSISKLINVLDVESYSQLGSQHIKQSIMMGEEESVTRAESIEKKLKQLWKVLQIQPLFDLQTSISELSEPEVEILSLVRALILKPQILVIEGGLDHIDSVNRRKITKWLIESQEIPILIDLTNRIEVIREYKRHLHFANGKLKKDQTF